MTRALQTIRFRRGLALVTVLWITMLMIVLVSVTSQSSLLDTHISHVNVERQRCRWACRAGIETAIAVLVADDTGYDCLTDDWGPDSEYLTDLEFEGCTVQITVTDTSSKLNMSKANKNQLLYLPDMTEEIADSILDWRDNNEDIRAFGAEDGYYMNLDIRYRPQNAAFKTTRELLRVRGVSEGLYYGDSEQELISEENEGWKKYLTFISFERNIDLNGGKKIDINNANERQLQQRLSLTREQAKWIADNRQFNKYSDILKETSDSAKNNRQNSNNNQQGSNNNRQGSSNNNRQDSNNNRQGSSNNNRQGSNNNRQGSSNNNRRQEAQAVPPDMNTALNIIDNAALNNRKLYSGRVNINTTGVVVLTSLLGGNRELAESIIAYRDGMVGGFTSMTDLQAIEGMTQNSLKKLVDLVSIRSSVYEIDCVAYSDATNLEFHVKAIVNREQSEGRILFWREGSSY